MEIKKSATINKTIVRRLLIVTRWNFRSFISSFIILHESAFNHELFIQQILIIIFRLVLNGLPLSSLVSSRVTWWQGSSGHPLFLGS